MVIEYCLTGTLKDHVNRYQPGIAELHLKYWAPPNHEERSKLYISILNERATLTRTLNPINNS